MYLKRKELICSNVTLTVRELELVNKLFKRIDVFLWNLN